MLSPVRRWAVGVGLAVVLAAPAARAEDSPGGVDKDALVRQLAARIDAHLEADWRARGITPAPAADDAEYVRRVYLDLAGRIPKVAEARAFLADRSDDKRARLVERLLTTPGYAAHFATVTRAEWLPVNMNDFRAFNAGNQFEEWLRREYA